MIIGWIAQDDSEVAIRFGDALVAKALAIVDTPLAFPAAGIPGRPDLRKRVHRDYLIIYRVLRQTVVIVRFVHGARDFYRLFPRP